LRPNIVIYLIDTLRADHLTPYGYPRPTSPHIDAFAKTGTLFEHALSSDTCTLGAIPSLLTGQSTLTHGVDLFGKSVEPNTPMIQTALSNAGYDTASFITNLNAGPAAGLHRGFNHLHDAIKTFEDVEALRTVPLNALETWFGERPQQKPFFLYVHTAEPHRPYTPPSPFRERLSTDYSGDITGVFRGETGYSTAKTEEEVAHVRALYDGEIAFADAGFQSFLSLLEQNGLTDNTLVVLTSDHGEELVDHGGWNHGHTVHRELVHVPLIVSGPGFEPARQSTPVSLLDVATTVLEAASVPVPVSFEGRSLHRPEPHRPLFTRSSFLPRQAAIRQDGFTLIQDGTGRLRLYDQTADPNEERDVSAQYPDRTEQMRTALSEWLTGGKNRPSRAMTEEERARLKALGYLE